MRQLLLTIAITLLPAIALGQQAPLEASGVINVWRSGSSGSALQQLDVASSGVRERYNSVGLTRITRCAYTRAGTTCITAIQTPDAP